MPCTSAILLLLFALANRVFLVGVTTILTRRVVLGSVTGYPRLTRWVTTGLSLAGAVLMVVIGGAFFAGAWTRL
ncbi:MAG TPA: hypothetical protein VGD07_18940 [Methylomirabilota bacterium]